MYVHVYNYTHIDVFLILHYAEEHIHTLFANLYGYEYLSSNWEKCTAIFKEKDIIDNINKINGVLPNKI